MHNGNPLPINIPSILKSKSQNLLTSPLRNKFNTLNNTWNNNMFNSTIFSLCILSNKNGIDICVGSFVACYGATGTDVCEEGERATEG